MRDFADGQNILKSSLDSIWFERDDAGVRRKYFRRLLNRLIAHRTNVAKFLCKDQIGLYRFEQDVIEIVYRAVAVELRANGVVDLFARHCLVRNATGRYRGTARDRG